MSKDIKIRKYLIVDHTKAEFLIEAESWQQAHQLAKQMNMKVRAVFMSLPSRMDSTKCGSMCHAQPDWAKLGSSFVNPLQVCASGRGAQDWIQWNGLSRQHLS